MSPRARAAKISVSPAISPLKSTKKSISLRNKKPSPTKQCLEQTTSISTQPRQKRLSSLTAATLLQHCTSILSPARKLKPKTPRISTSQKRQISNVSENNIDQPLPTRTRREASSRASAMIMQQNEIERSRYNYASVNESSIRRHPSKMTVTNKDETPSEPLKVNVPPRSVTNVSNQKEHIQLPKLKVTKSTEMIAATSSIYPPLTEAILAEHNRLQETTTAKQDNLLKWTQELALCGRLSPPYPEDEIPITKTNEKHSNCKEITPSILPVNTSSHSLEQFPPPAPPTNPVPTPTFLFPSSAYSLDLRSFYSLLPCWQYLSWPFQSSSYSNSSLSLDPKTSLKHHRTSIHLETKAKKSFKLDSITSIKQKKEALTFHLHTHHHHHHIHNSKSSSLLKSTKPTTVRLTAENSSISIPPNQLVEPKAILPLSDNNAIKKEDQSLTPTIENEVLSLAINNNGAIKKLTRRKSSPVKRRINSGTKSISQPSPAIVNSSVGDDKPIRRVPKRRSVSAVAASSPTVVSLVNRISRGKRTISATNRKRSHSPASVSLPLTNNHRRKKQKVLHYWILFGKSEQKLVSLDADKPPVFRECYSSIRHITEKDVIKSNDCVILRSEPGAQHGATPYLAKVKWFWEEPTTGEIQMSLIWYYHPEHTELLSRIRERFLPNELLASKYWDCLSVACIEDKCYVLNFNEYNRYSLREKSTNLFEHSEAIGQLKFLLNKNTPTVHHRPLPAKTVSHQNIFFCRYVYDYRVKRILKNPALVTTASSM